MNRSFRVMKGYRCSRKKYFKGCNANVKIKSKSKGQQKLTIKEGTYISYIQHQFSYNKSLCRYHHRLLYFVEFGFTNFAKPVSPNPEVHPSPASLGGRRHSYPWLKIEVVPIGFLWSLNMFGYTLHAKCRSIHHDQAISQLSCRVSASLLLDTPGSVPRDTDLWHTPYYWKSISFGEFWVSLDDLWKEIRMFGKFWIWILCMIFGVG